MNVRARDRRDEDIATQTIGYPERPQLGVRITILGAPATPATFCLARGSCVVGSSTAADIVVGDRAVSRAHIELSVVSGGVAVRDLGSRNGTFYLGQRVQQIVLAYGASLTVGSARIHFDADNDHAADALYDADELRGMVGSSIPMRRLFAMIERLDVSTVPVLITGESGVGKELVARALHDGSKVPGPLVSFNCGAVARELLMSELFGHRRGAFTGATETRRGAFESAESGTLFLDELGELPLEAQPALLRVLEAGEIRPVGGDQTSKVKVRVVAATNRDLEKEVREGRFREDLYYRLAVIKLHVPPLRERADDIALLARRFALAAGVCELPPEVIESLKVRPWPGNARELRNVVQAYAVLGKLPPPPKQTAAAVEGSLAELVDLGRPYSELKDQLLESFQRVYLGELLTYVRGNQSAAAKLAGMDRTYLGKLLARYRIGASDSLPPMP
jgi:transcriptional regulator with GAF, ATPase, and Fis domain